LLAKVEAGQDPMGVVGDPAKNTRIEFAIERDKSNLSDGFDRALKRSSLRSAPIAGELRTLFATLNGERLAKSLREPVSAR
jgi:5,5'-dehydrodivanillate O-demethylase oxygenase subunit